MNYLSSPTENLVLRGNDPTGHGYYGALRSWKKSKRHEGLDIVTKRRETLFAMTQGTVRIGRVYSQTKEGKPVMQLVEIKNSEHRVKLMYVEPIVKTGDFVNQGEIIGYAQDIASYHGSLDMLNHVHVSVWKNDLPTDPEPIIKPI